MNRAKQEHKEIHEWKYEPEIQQEMTINVQITVNQITALHVNTK